MMEYGCSSELPVDDDRQAAWAEQRASRGFDSTELWNLDVSFSRFALPRLKAFAEDLHGYPSGMTEETWLAELHKMIAAFELCVDVNTATTVQEQIIAAGLDSFRKYFFNLWS
jgi:hypothetical protein